VGGLATSCSPVVAAGQEHRARGFASSLAQIADDGVVLAAAISELGQDLTRPGTRATRTESGWRIDGRKMFCTMSPAATDLYVAVTYTDGEGSERYAYAMVPTGSPSVHDDWDALGMRASGSNSVSLEGVDLPASGLRGGFRAGDPLPYMERNLVAGPFHAAASLGIAESADTIARHGIAGRINGDARALTQVADNAVDLAAARGVLSRAGALIDDHRAANPASDGSVRRARRGVRRGPGRKAFVGEAAARIVERALALSGGAGYLNGSPLARLPRRQGRHLHAPARRQPRLRLPRPRRTRRSALAPLRWRARLQPDPARRPRRARSATHSAGSLPASRSSPRRRTASPPA
jgi:alkylation response protein AidB-like acyl-CoA dehydrogenase